MGDRCSSDLVGALQQQRLAELGAGVGTNNQLQQLFRLCKPANDFETRLSTVLRQLRNRIGAGDVELLATEMLARGYLVQVRVGSNQGKDARACLRKLTHKFLVCIGYQHDEPSLAGCGQHLLPEPLVLEPRFKEHFFIAHPTAGFEALVKVLPVCFVGTLGRLESVVSIMADEMLTCFKQQDRSIPPWRTQQALMSKWCPDQLRKLQAQLAASAQASPPPLPGPIAQAASAPPSAGPHGTAAPHGLRVSTDGVLLHGAPAAAKSVPAAPVALAPELAQQLRLPPGGVLPVSAFALHSSQQAALQQCGGVGTAMDSPQAASGVVGSTPVGETDASTSSHQARAALEQQFALHKLAPPQDLPLSPAHLAAMQQAAAAALAAVGGNSAGTAAGRGSASAAAALAMNAAAAAGDALRITRRSSSDLHRELTGKKMRSMLAAALKTSAGSSATPGANGERPQRIVSVDPYFGSRINTVRLGGAHVAAAAAAAAAAPAVADASAAASASN